MTKNNLKHLIFFLKSTNSIGMINIFFLLNVFIYLFLAVLGLHSCVQAFFSCGERGLPFVAVHRLLIEVASLVEDHGL